jgi:hypothetical protein
VSSVAGGAGAAGVAGEADVTNVAYVAGVAAVAGAAKHWCLPVPGVPQSAGPVAVPQPLQTRQRMMASTSRQ